MAPTEAANGKSPMRKILAFSIPFLSIQFIPCNRAVSECTIGVANGIVSNDARPLLWKSRMWAGCPDNQVVYFYGLPYDYIGVRNSGAYYPQMGLNSAGLCTGNSLVGSDDSHDGSFTEHILRNFGTVDEVRDYIQYKLPAGTLMVSGCFPLVDAAGNAAIFEINSSYWVLEYDAMNPNRAGQGRLGWVVRANEFHDRVDGTDDTSIGGRYYSGAYNIGGLIENNLLSARTIMQGNDGGNGYEFMRYGPGRPLATIAAPRVCSSLVVRGVLANEDPALATMWISLGQANYGIAVPTWVRVIEVPHRLSNGDLAALANSLRDTGNETDTQASLLPLEAFLFEETEALLTHWRSVGVPSVEEMTRVETRMAEDAYSLLLCLDANDYDNKAPTPAMSVSEMSGLSLHFQMTATDEDGSVERLFWDFGDDHISWAESPWHTYDTPGWYLVSCTVMDDDSANVTDWQYVRVPKGNNDGDGDVDLDDYTELPDCVTGPGRPPVAQGCEIFDFEADGDIDLFDFAGFQAGFTGWLP